MLSSHSSFVLATSQGCGADIRNTFGSQRALGPTRRTRGCGGWLIVLQLYVAILVPLNPKFQSAFVLFGAGTGSHLGSFQVLQVIISLFFLQGNYPQLGLESHPDLPKPSPGSLSLRAEWPAFICGRHLSMASWPRSPVLLPMVWTQRSCPDSHEPRGDGLGFQKSELN